nr:hypothetical protein [Candidatus Njordarchaeum guaymaensis]
MSLETATEKSLLQSKWVLVPIVLALYVVAIYLIQPFVAEGSAWLFIDMHNVIFAVVGALIFALVARRFGWSSTRPGLTSIIISIGLVLWVLAESAWLYYEWVGEEPFPSVADVFYIAGYFPFAVALLLNIRTIRVKFKPSTLALWIALSIVTFVAIALLAIIPIAQVGIGSDTLISMVYPFEDFVIIVLALVILLKFRSGEIAQPWGLLVLGFVLEAIGDIWFTYAENAGAYAAPYHPLDMVLTLGYVTIIASGLFFVLMYRVHGGRQNA